LLSEDWRLEMMKTLDRPESFSKQILKKEDAMLLATGFATVSQIANHCQIPLSLERKPFSAQNQTLRSYRVYISPTK